MQQTETKLNPFIGFWYTRAGKTIAHIATIAAPFILIILVWNIVSATGQFSPYQLPAPRRTVDALTAAALDGSLAQNLLVSFRRLGWGLLAGISLGTILGIAMGLRRGIAQSLEPVVTFMNALSGIAWIPLAIIWFGLGTGAVVFILWNAIFFLVLLNTLLGVRSVPARYVDAARTMGASRFEVIRDVLIPGAMPNILLGIRLGHAFGWRALIAAEVIGASSGIGFYIFNASFDQRSDRIIAGIIVIGVIVVFVDRVILARLERITVQRWGTMARA